MSKTKKYRYNRHTATFVLLLILSLAMIFPFVWMILSSFKTAADV
jgi:ABC-type glycerol-3-phosphate transport system permease component